jgi:hypothetical protein
VLTLIWVLAGGRRAVPAQELEDPRPGGRATPRREGGTASSGISMFLI